MPDKYDPYRERLVMETETVWSPECDAVDDAARRRIALELHESPAEAAQLEYLRTHTGFCRRIVVTPAEAAQLEYLRTHTGFCRRIVVTPADVERLKVAL